MRSRLARVRPAVGLPRDRTGAKLSAAACGYGVRRRLWRQRLIYYQADTVSEEERERLILEHLPQVRLVARKIHERLPDSDLFRRSVVRRRRRAHPGNRQFRPSSEREVEDLCRVPHSRLDPRQPAGDGLGAPAQAQAGAGV